VIGGHDHHRSALLAGGEPGLVGGVEDPVAIGGANPATLDVLVDDAEVAAAKTATGLGFPRVAEPADASELGCFGVSGQEAEQTAGVAGAGFHDLRRTNATQLVVAGVDVKTVQTRLGHADPRLTLAVYAQAVHAADRDAAARLDERFFGQVDTTRPPRRTAAKHVNE